MNKEFAKMNQTQIVTGFNTVALVVMLVWIIRTNLEFKNNLEDIRKEITDLKQNSNDNTKRSTLSLSRLSQRLEDQSQRLNSVMNLTQSLSTGISAAKPAVNSTAIPPIPPIPSTPTTVPLIPHTQTVVSNIPAETNDFESAIRALRM